MLVTYILAQTAHVCYTLTLISRDLYNHNIQPLLFLPRRDYDCVTIHYRKGAGNAKR